MLNRSTRPAARNSEDARVRRVREELKPVCSTGSGSATPLSVAYFDGEKSRSVFLPGISAPDSDTYITVPQLPTDMTREEWTVGLKERYRRLRTLV